MPQPTAKHPRSASDRRGRMPQCHRPWRRPDHPCSSRRASTKARAKAKARARRRPSRRGPSQWPRRQRTTRATSVRGQILMRGANTSGLGQVGTPSRTAASRHTQDTRLYMFLKPNQDHSVLPLMLQLATEWRTIMEKTPEKLTMSLREVMIRGLLKEWRTRLQAFQANEEARSTAQQTQDRLGPGKAGPCSHGEDRVTVHRGGDRQVKISELETLVTGDSIKNFKSIRQLRESYQKECERFKSGERATDCGLFSPSSSAVQHSTFGRKAPAGSPPILGSSAEHPSPALVRSAPQHTLLGFPLSSISFLNPSSATCYMNSSIHAALHILALLQPQDQAALGQLCQLWGVIQRNPQGFNPSQNLQWVMLMSPWTRLFVQNDAAEFMSHMLLRLRPSVTGRWEARKVEAGRELLRDEGLLHHPIALDIQGHTASQDAYRLGISNPPSMPWRRYCTFKSLGYSHAKPEPKKKSPSRSSQGPQTHRRLIG